MTFIYDSDCGFCQWSAQHLARINPALTITPSHPAAAELNTEHGVERGHRAIGLALAQAPRRWARIAGWVLLQRSLHWLFAGIYAVIARYRHRLGPLVGASTCRL
ncbi:hypothetical protein FRC0263_02103 [Corynebacterium diphtheriae]|nr:hypothetical protein FRC0263_02103 [Corynebacterium diphtheriae]